MLLLWIYFAGCITCSSGRGKDTSCRSWNANAGNSPHQTSTVPLWSAFFCVKIRWISVLRCSCLPPRTWRTIGSRTRSHNRQCQSFPGLFWNRGCEFLFWSTGWLVAARLKWGRGGRSLLFLGKVRPRWCSTWCWGGWASPTFCLIVPVCPQWWLCGKVAVPKLCNRPVRIRCACIVPPPHACAKLLSKFHHRAIRRRESRFLFRPKKALLLYPSKLGSFRERWGRSGARLFCAIAVWMRRDSNRGLIGRSCTKIYRFLTWSCSSWWSRSTGRPL